MLTILLVGRKTLFYEKKSPLKSSLKAIEPYALSVHNFFYHESVPDR